MKTKALTIYLIGILMTYSFSQAALVEDFEIGFDTEVYQISNSDQDSSFAVQDGKLWFHGWEYSGGSTDERGGWFVTKEKIYGDFITTADLTNFNAPSEGGGKYVLASICIWEDNGEIARIGRRRGYAANHDDVVVKINTQSAALDSVLTSGVLKIERMGIIVNAYWDDSLVFSGNFGNSPVYIGLIAERWGTTSYFDVAFDNFIIIPEPATISLLGFGLLALRRKK